MFHYHWYHLCRRYVHVSVVVCQETKVFHLSPSCTDFVTYFKHINAANFDRFFDQLKRLKNHGATELVMVEAAKTQRNMGGMGWYNCQTMCRDIARIETGFVINPWHLARKLDTDSANYRVIRRIKL